MSQEDILKANAKDDCDRIDSDILLDVIKEAGARLDKEPIPLIGRYWWNPETQEVERIS